MGLTEMDIPAQTDLCGSDHPWGFIVFSICESLERLLNENTQPPSLGLTRGLLTRGMPAILENQLWARCLTEDRGELVRITTDVKNGAF